MSDWQPIDTLKRPTRLVNTKRLLFAHPKEVFEGYEHPNGWVYPTDKSLPYAGPIRKDAHSIAQYKIEIYAWQPLPELPDRNSL